MRVKIQQSQQTFELEIPNFEFLPLFYLFPRELLENQQQCARFLDIPRNVHGLFIEPEWCKLIATDLFLEIVCDLTAYLVWPSFGIKAYIECFSGFDPLWKLAHAFPLWEDALERLGGPSPKWLTSNLKHEMPWLPPDEAQELFYEVGRYGIEHNHLDSIIQSVKEMRCFEDFDARGSHIKTDFIRKWYHTRAQTKTVSLDGMVESQNRSSYSDAVETALGDLIGDRHAEFEPEVCFQLDVQHFYQALCEKDRQILSMRSDGYTLQEITDRLGYKTHSAVLKRIRRIENAYLDLENRT